MKILLKGSQIGSVVEALDLYARIWIGQFDHIMYEMRWLKDCEEIDLQEERLVHLFLALRNILLPGLSGYSLSGSYGIFSRKRDIRAAVAYDLQQVIRYRKAWFEKPEGGYTVDFRAPYPCEDDPYPLPKAICIRKKEETILEAEMLEEQVSIIVDALEIRAAMESGDFIKLFTYFTEDKKILGYAEEITSIYSSASDSRYCKRKSDSLIELVYEIKMQIFQQKAMSGESATHE